MSVSEQLAEMENIVREMRLENEALRSENARLV
jgi:hypothetical protein